MAAAKTGKLNNKSNVVTKTVQQNKGIENITQPLVFMLNIVVIKLREPKILEILARCKEKMAQSSAPPEWARFPASGGYTVHLVPTLLSIKELINKKTSAGGNSQKLILFNRGKAMSGLLNMRGNNQFLNPLIITGITKKKIITKACAVTTTL